MSHPVIIGLDFGSKPSTAAFRCPCGRCYMLPAEGEPIDAQAAVDAVLDAAAHAVGDHQREGREWVRDSLWDMITQQAVGRIRALKGRSWPFL